MADFSLAYPIARGAAPALLALWAVVWLDEDLRSGGVLGLVALILGLVVVASTPRRALDRSRGGARSGVPAVLAVAMLISLYSVIDRGGGALRPARNVQRRHHRDHRSSHYTRDASQVCAVREVSVVLAALAGWLWLGEPLGGMRVVGALLICAGIVAIALLG